MKSLPCPAVLSDPDLLFPDHVEPVLAGKALAHPAFPDLRTVIKAVPRLPVILGTSQRTMFAS